MEMNQKKKIEEEINFKDLLKNPIRLFGWVYVYFFVIILLLGIFFGYKLIPMSFNTQAIGITDSTTIKKEIAESKGGIIPAVNLELAKIPSEEMITKGKELYDANCQSCHGVTGLGDGPAGIALNPRPRNFHNAEGWTNSNSIEGMYKTLQEGIISRGMAAYEYLSPLDRFSIIHYIRTFSEFPQITDAQINNLNSTYNLSAGIIKPNNIPISKAVYKIIEENNITNEFVQKTKEAILNDGISEEAKILKDYSYSIEKVIISYLGLQDKSFNNFSNVVKIAPLSYGYKPSILQLSTDELKKLYDFITFKLSENRV